MPVVPRGRSTEDVSGLILRMCLGLLAAGAALLLVSFALAITPWPALGPLLRRPVPWMLAIGLLLLVAYAAVKPSVDAPRRERDTPLFDNSTEFFAPADESPEPDGGATSRGPDGAAPRGPG